MGDSIQLISGIVELLSEQAKAGPSVDNGGLGPYVVLEL
jgi:hypothetical protein